MEPGKRNLHQCKHPFDAYPFDAFLSGSWQPVEHIKIESGRITTHFIDNRHMAMDKSDSAIRIRSRKATLSDCSCFLRPGIDICVLSASKCSDNSNEVSPDPRSPHDSECSCRYYVTLYVNQGLVSTETRTLSKEIKVVGLNQISILQKLEHNPCEDQPRRWVSSEDCSKVPQTKLLLGKFLSDLSWFVATSILENVSFCARSVDHKIVYHILGSTDATSSSLNTDSHINFVSFKVKDSHIPVVFQVDISITKGNEPHPYDSREDEVAPSNNVEGLRRSKRRNIQPKRYYKLR